MILPLSEARPATLSTVAAAITGTPWSMAYVTMWKIGPECAAQHAKYASAMAANCGVRSACPIVNSRPSPPAVAPPPAPAGSAGGSRTSRPAGMMTTSATSPSTSMAVRQSYAEIIQRAIGPITEEPRLSPADTRATARLRWAVNQRVVVAVIGA